jgi:hypothetical protein
MDDGEPDGWMIIHAGGPTVGPFYFGPFADEAKAKKWLKTVGGPHGVMGVPIPLHKKMSWEALHRTWEEVLKESMSVDKEYEDDVEYWTVEELKAKTRVELRAIARDLLIEVPRGAKKKKLLKLILVKAC